MRQIKLGSTNFELLTSVIWCSKFNPHISLNRVIYFMREMMSKSSCQSELNLLSGSTTKKKGFPQFHQNASTLGYAL